MKKIKKLTISNLNWPDKTLKEKTEWVSSEEYEVLKKEKERLAEIVRRECDGGVDLREEAQRVVEENHRLRAKIERLVTSANIFIDIIDNYAMFESETERFSARTSMLALKSAIKGEI